MAHHTTLKRFGLTSILIDGENLESALAVHAYLQQNQPEGLVELIPAAQTVLVRFDTAPHATCFAQNFRWDGSIDYQRSEPKEHTIDVVYDGEDLEEVAQLTGLSVEQVIDAHTKQVWSVAFAGFAPGFFYLHSDENVLEVPRRSSPRTAVPAGAVGLAGAFSGIYPRTSPGGWQLIGHTNAPLWDLSQDPPALLEPGNTVRFRSVREQVNVSAAAEESETPEITPVFEIKNAGAHLLFEDEGRRGLTHWGVSPSGFADPVAAHSANLLVGNALSATVLESLMGGFVLQAQDDAVVALTGARGLAIITEDEKPDRVVPSDTPIAVLKGQTLRVGIAEEGLRMYLAVRGGFATTEAAHSYSTDTMSKIGPKPLATGDFLGIAGSIGTAVAHPTIAAALPRAQEPLTIRVIFGPRDDWFTTESLERFCTQQWTVSAESDRIGVRLTGGTAAANQETPALERINKAELPSEGMISGAIQVPPNGEPVIFLADHPVTGGYPVIACVHPDDLRLIAQSQPGTTLTFTPFDAAPTSEEANLQESNRD